MDGIKNLFGAWLRSYFAREIQIGIFAEEFFCFFVVSVGGGGFVGEVSEVVCFVVKLN